MMKIKSFSILTVLFLMSDLAWSNGEKIYQQVCASCHSANFLNSPQMGDKRKWAPLIAEGQVTLTAHGYVGVRAMPPKGGKPDLTIEDFSLALNFMVNKSGGSWKAPDKKMLQDIKNEIVARQKSNKNK